MKVIATDKLDRGIYSENVIEENLTFEDAERMAKRLNLKNPFFHYKAVDDDYVLFVAEE